MVSAGAAALVDRHLEPVALAARSAHGARRPLAAAEAARIFCAAQERRIPVRVPQRLRDARRAGRRAAMAGAARPAARRRAFQRRQGRSCGPLLGGHARSQARRCDRAALSPRPRLPRDGDGPRLHDLERDRLEPRRPHDVLHRYAVAADLPLRLRRRNRRDREPARVRRSRARSRRPGRHDRRRRGLRLERAVRPLGDPPLRAATDGSIAPSACRSSARRRACSAGRISGRSTSRARAWTSRTPALAAQPQAGGVFALDVGVRGLPEPRFAG